MLFTLKHLLVSVALFSIGMSLGGVAYKINGIPADILAPILGFGFGILLLLLLSWPVYRIMHLRPLNLPYCPHCHKKHFNYHVPASAWPICVLVCVYCGKPTRLCMTRSLPGNIKHDIPNFYLRWPEFLGIWRLGYTPGEKSAEKRENEKNQKD